jgi:AraC-like DNA-binding protein
MPRPKLDPQQFVPDVAPQVLIELIELAGEWGVAPERLCAGFDFTIEDMRRGTLISNRQAWRMVRRALQLTGRPDLGLELGCRENLSHFGLPGFAMSTARTFGEAAEIGLHYQNQTGGLTDASLEADGRFAALIVSSKLHDASVLPFIIEEVFASVFTIARILIGNRFRLHSLELAYPAPAYAARYREIFDCRARFGCARNRCLFERRWFDEPITTHSAAMSAQLRTLLEQRAKEKAAPSHTATAMAQLLGRPGNATLTVEQIARMLEISVRTLRRRLSEDGTSFRAISERIRAETALLFLREQGMTVAETSERLGFSDARAFRRAFKRWVGQAPGEVRHEVRQIDR